MFDRVRMWRLILFVVLSAHALAPPAMAAERELNRSPPPSSAEEIRSPAQRAFPEAKQRPPLFPRLAERLDRLPAFFADSSLTARFRTFYLRKDRAEGSLSEAITSGGSLHYRSGEFMDVFSVEAEGFTSQPLYAPQDRDGTGLLQPIQDGYASLGIANARIRLGGLELVGFRQYLELPYVNRSDSRMTPNTFESLTLAKNDGSLRFSVGYTWKVKQRTSTGFDSLGRALGLNKDRGLAHAGFLWDLAPNLHVGAILGVIPDVSAGVYSELGFVRSIGEELEARIDSQFTYREAIGDDLLGAALGAAWNFGLRGSTSWKGAVFRLGVTVTGSENSIDSFFGTNPSYGDLMQRTFNRADEKAVIASLSYDFAGLGAEGLVLIANFAAAFDGKQAGSRGDAQEVDITVDYRLGEGWLESLWLRVRGSWLKDDLLNRDSTDVRIILRYELPVL